MVNFCLTGVLLHANNLSHLSMQLSDSAEAADFIRSLQSVLRLKVNFWTEKTICVRFDNLQHPIVENKNFEVKAIDNQPLHPGIAKDFALFTAIKITDIPDIEIFCPSLVRNSSAEHDEKAIKLKASCCGEKIQGN